VEPAASIEDAFDDTAAEIEVATADPTPIDGPLLTGPVVGAAEPATDPRPVTSRPVTSMPVSTVPVASVPVTTIPVEAVVEPFETPQQTSDFAPPVAEQIKLDLSVAKTPSLPESIESVEQVERSAPPLDPRPIVREPVLDDAPPVSAWPEPVSLLESCDRLKANELTAAWATEAVKAIRRIRDFEEFSSPEVGVALQRLELLSARASELAKEATTQEQQVEIRRVGYSLERRKQVWEQVHRVMTGPGGGFVSVGFQDLQPVLAAVEAELGDHEVGRGWRSYLRIEELSRVNVSGDVDDQRNLSRRVLRRLVSEEWLDDAQREYLPQPVFELLAKSLRRWAREPINYIKLLDDIEAYETGLDSESAAQVASVYQQARWSDADAIVELADSLSFHYRNANLRVAATAALINRLLPQPEAVEEDVHENILGAFVHGTSRTESGLKVSLQPDPEIWRIGLEARGEVVSETAASKGPATFFNSSFYEFRASKTLMVNRRGVTVRNAEAQADSATALRGFQTEFDRVPLVGRLARRIARNQHDDRVHEAQHEAEFRLETRARERLDEEVHTRLEDIEGDFRRRVMGPLNQLRLYPTALDMHTTSERLVIRYRLAGDHQLGAHTPRPQAPSDSLLSVQVHESVLNNTIDQLELAGQPATLPDLFRRLAGRFARSDLEVSDDIPSDVTIRFAEQDPIRTSFADGRVRLTMRIAELNSRRKSWRNFAVRTYYVPDPSQLQANLVREGVVELAGQRLRLGDQIALRGIFSKVFSKNRPMNIINTRLARQPGLTDLQVTQFVISDGWIGVALGPQRVDDDLRHLAREHVSGTVVR
jgi:hypothetical protein